VAEFHPGDADFGYDQVRNEGKDDIPPFETKGYQQGGGSSGGSSSGGYASGGYSYSSSGSSSGSSGMDPVEAAKMSDFGSIYKELWGEPATEEYLRAAVKKGWNIWEFEDHERHKPAFLKTDTARTEAEGYFEFLRNAGILNSAFNPPRAGKGGNKPGGKGKGRDDGNRSGKGPGFGGRDDGRPVRDRRG